MVQEGACSRESLPCSAPASDLLPRLSAALSAFVAPDEKSLERPPKGFSRCPVPEIDEYFELVAKYGKPLFKWDIIRPAFLWKLEQTISEMFHVEREMMGPEENAEPNINGDEMRLQREFILQKAAEFDGAPFTFQRLCELLLTPLRHYKRTDKYLRALEKTINVVTTITENGERITGVELFPVEENNSPTHGIEQPFFVQVDECDTPIETKLVAAGDRATRENGSPGPFTKEPASGNTVLINLSPSWNTKNEQLDENQMGKKERSMDSTSNESIGDAAAEVDGGTIQPVTKFGTRTNVDSAENETVEIQMEIEEKDGC